MPIQVICPGCDSRLGVPDASAGRNVRCPKCKSLMAIPAVREGAPSDFEVVDEPDTPHEPAGADQRAKRPKCSGAEEDTARRRDARRQDEDDEEDEPSRKPGGRGREKQQSRSDNLDRFEDDEGPRRTRRRSGGGVRSKRSRAAAVSGNRRLLFWGGLAAGLAVVAVIGVVAANFIKGALAFGGEWPQPRVPAGITVGGGPRSVTIHITGVEDEGTADAIDDQLAEILPNGGGGGGATARFKGRMTIILNDVPDIEQLARDIRFGRVYSVRQNVISVYGRKLEGPPTEPVARAIYYLKRNDKFRRLDLMRALSRIPPDERRAEVARLLEAVVAEHDGKFGGDCQIAVETLGTWGTSESVPILIKEIDGEMGAAAITALGKLKDPRAIEPIAQCFEKDKHTHYAKGVLLEFGAAAEDSVLNQLPKTRDFNKDAVCNILEKIGTAKSIPALEVAASDKNVNLRMTAQRAIDEIKKRQ